MKSDDNSKNRAIDTEPSATEDEIEALKASIELPAEHLELLRNSNGVAGFLPIQPYYAVLWGTHDLIKYATGYDELLQEELPYMLAFGHNGASEMLLYDRRSEPWRIVCCPSTSLCEEFVLEIASDFHALMEVLGIKGDYSTST